MMHNKFLKIFIVAVFMLVHACKDEDSKSSGKQDGSVSTEQLSNQDEVIETDSKRVLRNAPQYLASVAKLLNINPSVLSKASEYEALRAKLPSNTQVTQVNPSDSVFIAASKVATAGCQIYLKEDKSESVEEFVNQLANKASFDAEVQKSLTQQSLKILAGTELEARSNANQVKNSKIITCSYIVVTKILF